METKRNDIELKEMVREKYAAIAGQPAGMNKSSCCGATDCCDETQVYNIMADDYTKMEGYEASADLGLGCGLPTEFAHIKVGDTVVDLGSGAGNDSFVARKITGDSGKVVGIDFTPEMISLARKNAGQLGFNNVEFIQGDIDNMPLPDSSVDVIVSNCVLNLLPSKEKVFNEIFRTLKPGAHFSISDIVLEGELPQQWRQVAELYAGCVSGAMQKNEYLDIIKAAGFEKVAVQKNKPILLPENILNTHLGEAETKVFRDSGTKITSITVNGYKPMATASCCGSSCCN